MRSTGAHVKEGDLPRNESHEELNLMRSTGAHVKEGDLPRTESHEGYGSTCEGDCK